jgi:acyl-CoA synthetase (AMP-forming)/AMP-acid ligase II
MEERTVSVAIVDTDSKTLMPRGTVGEIWIHSPTLIPKQFWALPTLSNRVFKAHPTMYSQINEPVPKDFALETTERIISGRAVNESILLDEYVRTGLFGFTSDKDVLPGLDKPRVFICGIKRDRIVQKQHTILPTGEGLIRRIFYSNHLAGAMHGLISGLAAL